MKSILIGILLAVSTSGAFAGLSSKNSKPVSDSILLKPGKYVVEAWRVEGCSPGLVDMTQTYDFSGFITEIHLAAGEKIQQWPPRATLTVCTQGVVSSKVYVEVEAMTNLNVYANKDSGEFWQIKATKILQLEEEPEGGE